MKIPDDISKLLCRLNDSGYEAFVVGGCVRDSLLGLPPADWDICTAAKPEEIQNVFSKHTVIPTGIHHGTVTVVLPTGNVEITTYRQDGAYLDFRHPASVTFSSSLYEDLKRRDFTVNAMAYSHESGIIDPFGGQTHLRQRLLCCVGDPDTRFQEDALRILRALRFAAVYSFCIESKTADAIHRCKMGLLHISSERIWAELKKIMLSDSYSEVLFQYPDLLNSLFPSSGFPLSPEENKSWLSFMKTLCRLPSVLPLRLAGLFFWCRMQNENDEDYLRLCRENLSYLKTDRKTRQQVLKLAELFLLPLPDSLTETRQMIGAWGRELFGWFLDWKQAQQPFSQASASESMLENARCYHQTIISQNLCCCVSELAVTGKDLTDAGMSPGKEIGQALDRALVQVIAGRLPNEKKELINFLFS